VLDYVEGKADLAARLIRAIGNPHERIKEDRLRMIRAIRLACRFGFEIEEKTAAAIRSHAKELFPAVAIERVWQEFTKSHDFGKLRPTLIMLHDFGLLEVIFPELEGAFIEERLLPIKDYPAAAPTIASLLPLFPDKTLQKRLELCKKLKLSNLDQQFVSFLTHAESFIHLERPIEQVEWAYFYANSFAPTCLQILAAHLDARKRRAFLQHHEDEMQRLENSIQRIKIQDPVVKSNDLIAHGIRPGIVMGKLLTEAERIAINEQLQEVGPIIERLKELPLWPK
jgi:poly(A) polymerase